MRRVILGVKGKRLPLLKRALLWHLRYYLMGQPSPLSCSIYITNMCNLRCEMCNIWRRDSKDVLAWDIYKDLVNSLGEMRCYYLSFSGGEPLLVKDIVERVRYAKVKIPYVHIVTNGYLLDRDMAEGLSKARLDEVSISIDGIGKGHDTLRGVDGAFDKAVSAIENLRRYAPGIKVGVNTIISPDNIHELYKVVELVDGMGVLHKFQLINDHPLFEGQETFAKRVRFRDEMIDEVRRFIGFVKKKRNVVNSGYFLSVIPDYLSGDTHWEIFKDRCILGYHHCEVKEDGTLYPCLTAMDWKEGFDIRGGFMDVYYSEGYRRRLKELMNCHLCRRNMYICYLEPRVTFPIINFLKYNLFHYARRNYP